MRLGCIDIGSNTTRLLVADCDNGRLSLIHQERAFTRIGGDLVDSATISAAKIDEVVEVVADQLASARDHGAVRVCAVATAAIRTAENGAQLVAAIRGASELTVEVLSAKEEARLAFVGVAGTLERPPAGELGVVDVGGGSSEVAVGTVAGGVRWWASLPLGSGTLSHTWLRSDPPTAEELGITRLKIAAALAAIQAPHPPAAVAVGGSATSLGRLAGMVLDAAALGRALTLLAGAHSSEIADRFMIDPQRARLLPAGLLILEGLADLFGVPLQVGRGGIREGVLLEAGAT
jgi:exopolyphosphatase/guanosine-5'-triphosphate,3'-diphosphate pyrophosphatase